MTDARTGRREDVERYEQLRSRVLAGEPSGMGLGLALLERRGVAAWARAWQSTTPAPEARPVTAPVAALPDGAGGELVGALASMALATVAAG
jgi:hypothetical protein